MGANSIFKELHMHNRLSEVARVLAFVALGTAGCGVVEEEADEEFSPAKDPAPAASDDGTSTNQEHLIAFSCPTGRHDGNHMASRPPSECPNLDASGHSKEGMEYFQRFRKHLGLPCLEMRDYAQSAAVWHSVYMSRHAGLRGHTECFVDGHREKEGCEFFSGVTPRDQLLTNGMDPEWDEFNGQVTGEGIGCVLGPSDFITGMLAAPFHRHSMMQPQTDFAGFSTFWQNHLGVETWANTITMAKSIRRTDEGDPEFVVYPKNGDKEVPRAWNGIETPQPPTPPGGFPSGYPITVVARPGFVWTSGQLCPRPGGGSTCTEVPVVGLFNHSYPKVPPHAAHIYAHRPLESGTRYFVRFSGTKDGSPTTISWFFTTRTGDSGLIGRPRPTPTPPR
ncbi:MAG TPA: hypothetical protein VGF45_08510 [Polyangia bacterium]